MNNPDKQYTDLIGDAYKNYGQITNEFQLENPIDDLLIKTLRGELILFESDDDTDYRILTKKEFINKIKTDDEFAKKWGFQVYTKELSRRERSIYYYNNGNNDGVVEGSLDRPTFEENEVAHEWYNDRNVPKQIISLTYNNQTIEIYE